MHGNETPGVSHEVDHQTGIYTSDPDALDLVGQNR